MRTVVSVALLTLAALVACDICSHYPDFCLPPSGGETGTPPSDNPPASSEVIFTWHRDGAALDELTRLLSLRAHCVDRNGGFLFVADSLNYEGEAVDSVEEITLMLPRVSPYGDHRPVAGCYALLRQNDNETPSGGPSQPGSGTYVLDGVEHQAPLLQEGQFAGFWVVDVLSPN